jgi:hypothetical protein
MAQSIHDYDGRLRSVIRRIRAAPIGQKNRSLILKFEEECVVNGLSKGRIVKYLYYMLRLAKWMRRDFAAANLGDIRRVVGEIMKKDAYDEISEAGIGKGKTVSLKVVGTKRRRMIRA